MSLNDSDLLRCTSGVASCSKLEKAFSRDGGKPEVEEPAPVTYKKTQRTVSSYKTASSSIQDKYRSGNAPPDVQLAAR